MRSAIQCGLMARVIVAAAALLFACGCATVNPDNYGPIGKVLVVARDSGAQSVEGQDRAAVALAKVEFIQVLRKRGYTISAAEEPNSDPEVTHIYEISVIQAASQPKATGRAGSYLSLQVSSRVVVLRNKEIVGVFSLGRETSDRNANAVVGLVGRLARDLGKKYPVCQRSPSKS